MDKTEKSIKNRIVKTELIEWKGLKELQPKGFKELSKAKSDVKYRLFVEGAS